MVQKRKVKKVFIVLAVLALAFLAVISVSVYVKVQEAPDTTPTNDAGVKCTRKEPYKLAPEFERARSLRNQRLQEAGITLDYSFYNCINIDYADLSKDGAEGMFSFDQNSSIDNLKILVDNSYKIKDDILTAILLQHEITHVGQFVSKLQGKGELSCIDSEVQAFSNELVFMTLLNPEEKMSLVQRIIYYQEGGYNNSASLGIFSQINQLISLNRKSSDALVLKSLIDKWVRQNPAYQSQCGI